MKRHFFKFLSPLGRLTSTKNPCWDIRQILFLAITLLFMRTIKFYINPSATVLYAVSKSIIRCNNNSISELLGFTTAQIYCWFHTLAYLFAISLSLQYFKRALHVVVETKSQRMAYSKLVTRQ